MSDDESIVIRPREPFTDLIQRQDADELAKFMEQPLTVIAESITGALAAGRKLGRSGLVGSSKEC